jgi:hypothetical protein
MEIWNVQELSTREGARQLNISKAAFKSRLMRAKTALRTELARSKGMLSIAHPRSREANSGALRCARD